ncbi:DNA polymerase III subunit delta' [Pseudanabaena sp. FACHB-2040]|uniref:DNA polymerase III subunit delta' n=1 Tax=Pseudanabaena sp. FACHB-2040 TaxID=2692859 RepID=UPI0016853330|nr:DNA polymerase III subunit delta' [Pseudanabaena sp. FACHB-2040]MBD2256914.1 DNA polymerase III subunit delta' [Pseudanabaena sp. FACHB-2040]
METFKDLKGQEMAVELLGRAVQQQRIAPAYLFAGPEGVGRRLAAERFAEVILTHFGKQSQSTPVLRRRIHQRNHPDLLWVEPTYLHQGRRLTAAAAAEQGLKRKSTPQIRLEQIREIGQFLSRPPLETARAVVVLEGAETMAEAPANGLLKTLEEPGAATLILLAPDTSALLPTLVSRCQLIPFRRLGQAEMAAVLCDSGHEAVLDQPDLMMLAQGSPGSAIAAYEQKQAIPADLLANLLQPPADLRDALERGRQIANLLDTEAQLWLVDYLQHCYWQQSSSISPAGLQHLEQARKYLRSYVQPRLVWEVTFMRLLEATAPS